MDTSANVTPPTYESLNLAAETPHAGVMLQKKKRRCGGGGGGCKSREEKGRDGKRWGGEMGMWIGGLVLWVSFLFYFLFCLSPFCSSLARLCGSEKADFSGAGRKHRARKLVRRGDGVVGGVGVGGEQEEGVVEGEGGDYEERGRAEKRGKGGMEVVEREVGSVEV